MTAMIEISGLTKRFENLTAVDDVSFSVGRGEVLGFLGPNGAGKSTTMRMLTGFLTPSAGTAAVCGHDIRTDRLKAQRRLGYLPEGAPSYGDMSARAFLDFIAQARGLSGPMRTARILDVARAVRIADVLHRPIETLSKGYKRRVGLAQAILHDPDVLVLDEPTDGLDPNQKAQVRDLIREMAPDKAIVISTHILEEVDSICDRAIIVAAGAIVFDGTPDALARRSDRHNAVTIALADPHRTREARRVLSGLEDVADIRDDDDPAALVAIPVGGRAIVAGVAAALSAADIPIGSLRSERGRLDDVFRLLTERAQGVS